jgi:YVTN family beta-propeller protein
LAPGEQAGAVGQGDAARDRGVILTQVGSDPSLGAVDPITHTAYVPNFGSGTVSVINDRTCSTQALTACGGTWATVTVGSGPNALAIDQATDTIYVANANDNTVSVIDGATCNAEVTSGCGQSPRTLKVGLGPQAPAFDPATKTLYVTDNGPNSDGSGDSVSVIDAATCNAVDHAGCGQTPAAITVGPAPIFLDLNATNDTVYVGNAGDNTVSVIDGANCNASVHFGCNQHPPKVAVGTFPLGIAFDPASDSVYVANGGDNTVSVINGATCNATDHAGCAKHPTTVHVVSPGYGANVDVAVDDANHTAYDVVQPCPCGSEATAGNGGGNLVAMIDTASCNGATTDGCSRRPLTSPAGGYPFSVFVDLQQHTVYAGLGSNTLALLNANRCNSSRTDGCPRALPTVAVGDSPDSVAVDQRTHTAYVSNGGSGTVSVVNTAICEADDILGCRSIAPTVSIGQGSAGALAVDETTDTVYMANFVDGTVSVIDGRTCNATHQSGCGQHPPVVTVAAGPDGVAVDQATDTVYVASDGTANPPTGDTVSVIDGQTCNASVTSGCSQTPPEVTLGGPNPTEPAVDEATDTVYVPITGANGRGDKVAVINGAICNATVTSGCGQIPHNIKVGAGAGGAAINAATDTVYVTNFVDDTVSVIDGSTCNGRVTSGCGQVTPTVTVGSEPTNVAVDQATGAVYVANLGYETASLDFTVSVIKGATCNAMQISGCGNRPLSVEVGGNPFGVAVNDRTGTVYVTNAADHTVSVFEVEE